jgi:CHAD domain-containing protein
VRAGDPDAVHDMRVATRRLRSTLRSYRKLLDRERTEPVRAELRWLGQQLGAVRDSDVLAHRLDTAVAAEPPELVVGPVAARIRQHMSARTAKAREDLLAALDSPRYAELLAGVDRVVAVSGEAPSGRNRLVRRAGRALRRADEQLDGARTDVALHEARKAYKRARYAVELVEPLVGKPARRLTKRLKALQDILGTHQDAVVAGDLLRQYGMRAHLEGENAFTYGLLHARQYAARQESLRDLRKVRRSAQRGKVRRWLIS